jgi:adenylate kinase
MRQLSIPQISTGDMLRDAVARQTPPGKAAKQKMDAGELVSDDIVNGIVAERIEQDDCKNGFILDGYPRNEQQAETFNKTLRPNDKLFVIEIGSDSADFGRLTGRLMCPGCGDIYNIYSRAPKSEGICDRDGRQLVQRSDDRKDLIKERFRTYDGETHPLIEFYQRQGVYHHVNGMRPIDEVTKNILAIVDGAVGVRSL